MDPDFQRLLIPVRPPAVWVRDSRFRYRKCEGHAVVLEVGQLCQIGVHLRIEGENSGAAYCQIVSGENRGLRFEYKSYYFEPQLAVA